LFDYDNLSHERVVYQVRVRLSFTRFLRLGFEDSIRMARRCGCSVRRRRFGQHLEAKRVIARGGRVVDATIVALVKLPAIAAPFDRASSSDLSNEMMPFLFPFGVDVLPTP
jgi:hypothetical protein